MNNWIELENLRQGFLTLIQAKELIRKGINIPFSDKKSVWQEYWSTPGIQDFHQLCVLLNEAENFARESIRRYKNGK